uniref:Uncharacterized protein n=1 Tax=Arundo donax TaxID=35708 RepID=A0A0A9A877_ARUDO
MASAMYRLLYLKAWK